jgi:hypothetical protein
MGEEGRISSWAGASTLPTYPMCTGGERVEAVPGDPFKADDRRLLAPVTGEE